MTSYDSTIKPTKPGQSGKFLIVRTYEGVTRYSQVRTVRSLWLVSRARGIPGESSYFQWDHRTNSWLPHTPVKPAKKVAS